MKLYHIAPVDKSYNKEMLEILSTSPIKTKDITISFDRQPDIFKLAEIKYNPYEYYGFFRMEKMMGFGMIGYHNAMINSKPDTVFHIKDFYTIHMARGRGFILKIAEKMFRETYNEASIGYAVIMTGNKDPLHYVNHSNASFPYIPRSRIINQLDVRNILLTLPLRRESNYSIRKATEEDIPVITSLLNAEHKDRLFGNLFKEVTFKDYLNRRPGLEISNYYLAFDKNGQCAGVCAAWDCSSFKQTRVLSYGKRFLVAKIGYKALSKLFGQQPLPIPGAPFKDFIVTDYAVRERNPAIMKALLKVVYHDFMKKGYQIMIWGSSMDDPLLKASKGFFYQRVISNIVLISTDPGKMEKGAVRNHLPYIDLPCL